MTFLAPGFFLASLAVAAAVVALHFIVTRQPRAGVLPTARFVPDLPATATARATRPSDLLLMLLRVFLILAAGAGLARPVLKPSRVANARVILVDASRSATNVTALRDSARSAYRDGDALIAFDSAARIIGGNAADSLAAVEPSRHKGNLSAALIAALRAGSGLRDRADSLELVVVSPFAAEEADAATASIRRLWPGRARLIRIEAPSDSALAQPSGLEIKTDASDPLAVTTSFAKRIPGSDAVIHRNVAGAADPGSGPNDARAIVEWPAAERPRWTVERNARDTIGGVVSGSTLVVAGFERRWRFSSDSLRNAQVIARWIDGEPAAIERPVGKGCVRSVAIPVNPIGDLAIGNNFVRFVSALTGPCAGRRAFTPMSASAITELAGSGGLAPRESFSNRGDATSWLAPWLLGLALTAAVAELFVRRRRTEVVVIHRSERKAAA